MVCGPARCGKDTLVDITLKRLGKNWKRYAFADKLKRDCEKAIWEKFGVSVWDDDQKHIFRQYLIDFGMARREETDGKYLIDSFIDEFEQTKYNYIISDFRFLNEFKVLDAKFDESVSVIPIYIDRITVKDSRIFTLAPEIPQEIDEYHEIRKQVTTFRIPWVNNLDDLEQYRLHDE